MDYKLPKAPYGYEVVAFRVRYGFNWRISYWAWRLFNVQVPISYKGFVIDIKASSMTTPPQA